MKIISGMTQRTVRTASLGVMAWLGTVASGWALDVSLFGVFKTQDYLQISPETVILNTNYPPYSFTAMVEPNVLFTNQVVSASVEIPPFGFVEQLMPPPLNSDQVFVDYFSAATQAGVDTYYPTGIYTLRINTAHDGNKTLLLNVPTNQFPASAPRIVNFAATQNIDPAQNFTFQWDAYPGGTTNDYISFAVFSTNGVIAFRAAGYRGEPGHTYLSGTNTSVTMPAGSIQPGVPYLGYIFFEKQVAFNTNYPGARGLVGFSKATSFYINLFPPVAPARLFSGGLAPGQYTLRVEGTAGARYVIQATTNLASGVWTPVFTNYGSFTFTDDAGYSRRFYRAVY